MALPEIIKDIEARVKDTGDTMTGLLNAHGGISLNSSTLQETPQYLLGIKAFADGGNIIWQNIANVSVGTATKAFQDGNGKVIASTYLPLAGGTMTGALNLANGTWNKAGDDAQFGDANIAGSFNIQGLNGNTNLRMVQYGGTAAGTITWTGSSFTFSNHIMATNGLTWNHATWLPSGNIYCTPTGNSQEWSIDVGSADYTGSWWHVWSSKLGATMLACYADNRHVEVPVHLYIGGYNNTSYALSTSSFICNSWIRSVGNTGWYNESHGGGWYMTDGTYVRSYNSKAVIANNSYYVGTTAGAGTGLSLYNVSPPNSYGIHMSLTSNYGTFGGVSGDWATYFCFDGATNRGWIFKHAGNNVASINGLGQAWLKGVSTCNRGYSTSTSAYSDSALEIREYNFGGAQSDTWGIAPRLSFHWAGRVAAQIGLASNGSLYVNNNASASTAFNKIVLENGGTWGINITGSAGSATYLSNNSTMSYGWNGLQYFNASMSAASTAGQNNSPTADWYHIIRMNHANANGYYFDIASCFHSNNMYFKRVASGGSSGWLHIWVQGNSVTGAVWNDYAECREADTIEPGYVLVETGDDTLTKSTERLSPFAGVSSDTWGFSQGETDKAKTPIAVAGRVLVYPWQDRNNYKPGDCVCAAPDGKVDIMTEEEIYRHPDRIIGVVSCVPDYEEWGGGENADRPSVKVDGRIWVRVK